MPKTKELKFDNIHPDAIKLIKMKGSVTEAAKVCGYSTPSYWRDQLRTNKGKGNPPNPLVLKRTRDALNGVEMAPLANTAAPSSTKQETIIIIVRLPRFEYLYNLFEPMGVAVSYKKKLASHWFAVIKASSARMVGLKALVKAEGAEVIEP